MSKLTAVEILEIKLLGIVSFDSEVLRNKYKEQFKIAKEVEKEQIIEAHFSGMEFIAVDPNKYVEDAEEYYNETYKKEEK
jgi:hypothetical protein